LVGNQHAKGHAANKTTFAKGGTPWNKGMKGIHLSPSSEFSKGTSPDRSLPLGSITIRNDKGKRRRWIKVAEPDVWREYAKVAWETTNEQTIVPGMLIHHCDGDTLNDAPDNLQCVSRAEHIGIHQARGDLRKV
jgi:hypothetical protein